MKNTLCLIVFALLAMRSWSLSAQSTSNLLEIANFWERKGNLNSAVYFYEELFKENPVQPIGVYEKYATLTRQIYAYSKSEDYYKKICLSDSCKFYPQAFFYWAMTLKNTSKYQEAIAALEKYQQTADQDAVLRKRLPIELDFLNKIVSEMDTGKVEIEKLPSQINTSYSEFNAMEDMDKGIYFTTLRSLTKGDSRLIDDYYVAQIYLSSYAANGLREGVPLNHKINNNKYNNTGFCLNENKDRLYFSRSLVEGKDTYYRIYVSQLDAHGEWGRPVLLPKQVNAEHSSNMQPFIVNGEDFDVLYFVSNRQGGFGGWDIWYCIITEEQFSEAINLGSNINTSGNEITPFYQKTLSKLFFSSDFHGGYGGYDIFSVEGALGAWKNIQNLGLPINSSANDSYFSCNELGNAGFFSSNRIGSYHDGESESCCYDIYSFTLVPEIPRYFTDTIKIYDYASLKNKVEHIFPITLYFHNDEPNPRSTADTTHENFANVLHKYMSMKDLYKKEYAKGLKGTAKAEAEQEIEKFFTSKVAYGLELIDTINKLLLFDLYNGYDVTLTIKGFASPLFTDEYNTNLSMRRIVCFENYIHQNPLFQPYLDTNTSGNKLRFVAEPKGKNLSEKYVSNNPNDKRNSIYSIAAANERRIQIMQYERSIDKNIYRKPILLLASENIDIPQQKNIDYYHYFIEIRNAGTSALLIDSVFCSSQKIDAKLSVKQIQPNETVYLQIEYKGRFEGNEKHKVKVLYNQTSQEIVINPIAL